MTERHGSARLVVNPAAGRGAGRKALPRLFRLAQAARVMVEISESREHLAALARQAVAEGIERLIVAGGDGTQHLALQALPGSSTALAVLPLGSGNDLAAALGMPRDLEAAFGAALAGTIGRIDVGRVADEYFAGVAGLGFDSEVARHAQGVRLLRGRAIYVYSVLRALGSFRPPLLSLRTDTGESFHGPAMLVAFGNIHRYGGGVAIAPEAVPDDGLLDVVVVGAVSKLELLRVFPRAYRGAHVPHPEITIFRASRIEVALDRPLTVYGDGEAMAEVGPAGATVELLPRSLGVVRR
jgi:diacylglycerol kinase (ATP)